MYLVSVSIPTTFYDNFKTNIAKISLFSVDIKIKNHISLERHLCFSSVSDATFDEMIS